MGLKPKLARTKKGFPQDQRLTTCSDCRFGIFVGQESAWSNRGLVHTECKEKDEIKIS